MSDTVISADGTAIAYTRTGQGPAVVLVDGAMCFRGMGPAGPRARQLADRFTVYTYDRRGRGESGDTAPYTVEREVEDLDALIKEAGGDVYLYGISSGAVLACDAAARLGGIRKLAVYEPPFIVDGTHEPRPDDYLDKMDAMIAQGRRGDAVATFMRTVGMPRFLVGLFRLMPNWPKLKRVAHTLPYDFRVLGDTGAGRPLNADRWAGAQLPALVMDGGRSPQYMRNAAKALAGALPQAGYRTLPGQTHLLKPEAVAPVLKEWFA